MAINEYDVTIVGGGPAGLSAALTLGRCRRRVVVCDAGSPRNAASREMHCYLSRDGIDPARFLQMAREELHAYDVEMCHGTAVEAETIDGRFHVRMKDGSLLISRALLLATGVRDRIPRIDGIEYLYGISVHHCPYCDGWEERDRPIAIYGRGKGAYALSRSLKRWSDDLILFTDGSPRMSIDEQQELVRLGITTYHSRIVRLEGTNGRLERVVLATGEAIEREAMFFTTGQDPSCELGRLLGCRFTKKGVIWTDSKECTSIPRIYAAGDASRDAQLVIVAAAEGAKAAVAINMELQEEDVRRSGGEALIVSGAS